MNVYTEAMLAAVSMEGVQKANIETRPTPEGAGLISIKEVEDTDEFAQELETALSSILGSEALESGFFPINGHLPRREGGMFGDKPSTNNYVQDGVYMPDLVRQERSSGQVMVVDRNVKISSLNKRTIYYVNGDDDVEVVAWLKDQGFYAGLDVLSITLEMKRFNKEEV